MAKVTEEMIEAAAKAFAHTPPDERFEDRSGETFIVRDIRQPIFAALEAALSTPPEPVGVEVKGDLDGRMKAAGMYTIAEMMGVTPLTRWKSNPAINTIEAFSEWLDRKSAEYLQMKAGYDLGDKAETDELYEWVLAHTGAFTSVRDQWQVVLSALTPEAGKGETHTPSTHVETAVGDDKHAVALAKINDIRNSIIGFQTINWSEHIYPLVAALEEAGIEGAGYPASRANVGTMLDRTLAAESKAEAFDKIVAARKAFVEAVAAYNSRLEFVKAERERGNHSCRLDREYETMTDAQVVWHKTVQTVADAALAATEADRAALSKSPEGEADV